MQPILLTGLAVSFPDGKFISNGLLLALLGHRWSWLASLPSLAALKDGLRLKPVVGLTTNCI